MNNIIVRNYLLASCLAKLAHALYPCWPLTDNSGQPIERRCAYYVMYGLIQYV